MKTFVLISALFLWSTMTEAVVEFPDDSTLSEQVEQGHVTHKMHVKFQPASDVAIAKFVERVIDGTTCSTGTRIFSDAGVHEENHRQAGLHLWYEFDCASAAPPGSPKGKGPQNAIARLKSHSVVELESPQKFGLRLVEAEYEKTANQQQIFLRGHRKLATSNDPRFNEQEHYATIKLQQAWDILNANGAWVNAANTVVQVLDSGWDLTHEDSGDNLWDNPGETCGDGIDNDGNGYVDDCHGYNHADNTGTDLQGGGYHGSHCAGTISANTDNDKGVAGIAGGLGGRGVSVMVNVGFGATAVRGFAAALMYGADNGAHVSSNSWGYTCANCYNQAELDAIDYATNSGVVVVFAAGNDDDNGNWYPGYYDKTMAVAATDSNKEGAWFTNYGHWVDIAAPGVNVLSTTSANSYERWSGTSMACPHVAGVLALGKTLNPSATAGDLKACLFSTAEDIDGLQTDSKYVGNLGAGMVDAEAFLNCLAPSGPTSPPTTPSPTTTPPAPSPTTTPPTPSPTTPPPVQCSDFGSKNTCNSQQGCFWCNSAGQPTNSGNPNRNSCCTV